MRPRRCLPRYSFNSIPKSGTHLLKNILRMFVPIEQHYRAQFIQWGNLQQNLIAFDPARRLFSYGHLFFSDASAIELAGVRRSCSTATLTIGC